MSSDAYTVLGGGGFIGRHLVPYLEGQGFSVRVPSRDDPDIYKQDLGRVIYCIGLTGDFIERPLDSVEAHVCVLENLLRHASFSSLVYLSSTRLYDGQVGLVEETAPLVLNSTDRRHIYDFSKGLGEALCHAFPERHMVVARISSVYSDDLTSENFLHAVCRRALAEDAFVVQSLPEARRDYIHIEDVCWALVRLSQQPRQTLYNVASGSNVSNQELMDIVSKATGCRISLSGDGDSRAVPQISISRMQHEFGFSPSALRDRLKKMLASRWRRNG